MILCVLGRDRLTHAEKDKDKDKDGNKQGRSGQEKRKRKKIGDGRRGEGANRQTHRHTDAERKICPTNGVGPDEHTGVPDVTEWCVRVEAVSKTTVYRYQVRVWAHFVWCCVAVTSHPQPPLRRGHGSTVGVNRDPPV